MYMKDGKLDVSATYASLKYVMGGPSARGASRIALYTGELLFITANSPIAVLVKLAITKCCYLRQVPDASVQARSGDFFAP